MCEDAERTEKQIMKWTLRGFAKGEVSFPREPLREPSLLYENAGVNVFPQSTSYLQLIFFKLTEEKKILTILTIISQSILN